MKIIFKSFSVAIFFLFLLPGCSKNIEDLSNKNTIQFTYNGKQYDGGTSSAILDIFIVPPFIFANFNGLHISRPDIFGGDIEIRRPANSGNIDCAFLSPAGNSVGGPCNNLLTSAGTVIDSVRTYWIESGSLGYSYSDCKELTNLSVPGQKDCIVSGTFNLTLTNKNNQKIILTDGTFSGRIKKYN